MNNSRAEILRAYLLAQSGAVFTDPESGLPYPLFISSLPDAPDNAACIYDTAGIIRGRLLKSGTIIESFGLQIKVRGSDYVETYKLLLGLAKQLSKVTRAVVTLDATSYTIDSLRKTSSVLSLGKDEKRRTTCSVNFLMDLLKA